MSLDALERSAKNTFPNTNKRQNSVNSVRVSQQTYDRLDGDKLQVTAKVVGESNTYQSSILFSGVQFVPAGTSGAVDIGATEAIMPIESSGDCKVRCECLDFHWTFAWYNHNSDSLIGQPPKPYQKVPGSNRPDRNPAKAPGICKHIMKLASTLKAQGVLK